VKEIALSLIKAAATIFPPLAELLLHAVDNAPLAQQSLADEVRGILPLRSETRKALDELDAGKPTP